MKYSPILIVAFALLGIAGCQETNDALIHEGNVLIGQGKDSAAIKQFSEVIARNPKLQLPYYDRAICYLHLKQNAMALKDLLKIDSLQSGLHLINFISPTSEEKEEAKAEVDPNVLQFQVAEVYFLMGKLKTSLANFQDCMDKGYEMSKCRLWMGTIYIKLGDKKKGCDLYQLEKVFGNNEVDSLISGNCK